jgi:hypothetical protein
VLKEKVSPMPSDEPLLQAIAKRIEITVNETGRCLLTQPAELAPFKTMQPDTLLEFAANHGWTAVPRLGFTQLEFFRVHLARVPAGLI